MNFCHTTYISFKTKFCYCFYLFAVVSGLCRTSRRSKCAFDVSVAQLQVGTNQFSFLDFWPQSFYLISTITPETIHPVVIRHGFRWIRMFDFYIRVRAIIYLFLIIIIIYSFSP